MNDVTRLNVPVYFFEGRRDYTSPGSCAVEYFNRLTASSKTMIWFEKSAHFPFLEQPLAFAAALDRTASETRARALSLMSHPRALALAHEAHGHNYRTSRRGTTDLGLAPSRGGTSPASVKSINCTIVELQGVRSNSAKMCDGEVESQQAPIPPDTLRFLRSAGIAVLIKLGAQKKRRFGWKGVSF